MRRTSVLLRDGMFLIDGSFQLSDVRVSGGMIVAIDHHLPSLANDVVIPLDGAGVSPGLINSHDHLEFNLFSHLGNPPYMNYVDWSNDLQSSFRKEIELVLRVPLKYRLLWGAYKNLFSGVTTVVHHNDYYWQLRLGYPIEVFHPYHWIHSLRLEKRDVRKLIASNSAPRFIHLAEGVDSRASKELQEFCDLGGTLDQTVFVHGVGFSDEDIGQLIDSGAALVWCPGSNMFLFNATAPVEKMFDRIPIFLGSDSTLTGPLNLLDEMRTARSLKQLPPRTIVNLVTVAPATYLSLNEGVIRLGTNGNFLMFDVKNKDPFESLVELTVEDIHSVWRNGIPLFGYEPLQRLIPSFKKYSTIEIKDKERFVVGDFPGLSETIRRFSPTVHLPEILPG